MQVQKTFYKNGTELTGTEAATFTNTLLRELSITKELAGLPKEENQKFTFTVELKLDGSPLTGTFPADNASGQVEFNGNGQANIELAAGETLTIRKIPYGTVWKVTETNTAGYEVQNSIGNTGNTASGISGTADAVTFTNKQLADLKLIKTNPENIKLADVELELYTSEKIADAESFTYNGVNYYKVQDITTTAEVMTITSLPVYRLKDGAYIPVQYLIRETKAANGYAVLKESVVFHFDKDNSVVIENPQDCFKVTDEKLQIINYELEELPATGGKGTYWFTITGAAMMMMALLILLYGKKRRTAR